MGVVANQSFKYSIVSYFSFLIGTISSIFLYPQDLEFIGKIRFIQPIAELLFPFLIIGLGMANVKFYQQLKKSNQFIDFIYLSFLIACANYIVLGFLFYIVSLLFPQIKSSNVWEMKNYILISALMLGFMDILINSISNYKKIAIVGVFERIFPKLGAILSFCFFVYFGMREKYSLYLFVSFLVLAFIGLLIYFFKINTQKRSRSLSSLKVKAFRKEVIAFSLFTSLGVLGSKLALRIDNLMIGEFIDYTQNGVYSILISVVSFLSIPLMGVYSISGPIVVEKMENKDIEGLKDIYHKVSIVLFAIGMILFVCIVAGVDSLFMMMKGGEELLKAIAVVYILGPATLFDLSTGFNTQIISYSKHYKFNIYLMLILALVTIILNLVFIKVLGLGIVGVALATAISLVLVNIIKVVFNYKKFGIQPFSIKYLYILIAGIVALLLLYILPRFSNNLVNILVRPTLVIVYFIGVNYMFKLVPEFSIKTILKSKD